MPERDATAGWTPGPWQYIASTEHHGPYVTSEFGNTICDCYTMTLSGQPSTRNGGPSKPVPFLPEMADPNARLIAAAPNLYLAVKGLYEALDRAMDYIGNGWQPQDIVQEAREARNQAIAALALARGETND